MVTIRKVVAGGASTLPTTWRTWIRQVMSAHRDEGMVGEFWGSQGSGLAIMDTERILLLKRSPHVLEPGTWGIPGGAVPIDGYGRHIDIQESAFNEADEEMGHLPPGHVVGTRVFQKGSFKFTTFLYAVEDPDALTRFKPRLNWESSAYKIVNMQEAASMNLHPGVRWLLEHL